MTLELTMDSRCDTKSTSNKRKKIDKLNFIKIKNFWDFPGGEVVKNLPANAGDRKSVV